MDPLDRLLEVPADRLLVVTDLDGTLAPIVPDPARAAPLPDAVAALRACAGARANVAVLSGRSPEALRVLVGATGVRLLGDYGFELASGDGGAAIARFARAARGALAGLEGVEVEAKPASASVHYRSGPAAREEVRRRLAALPEARDVDLRDGRMVVEALPAGWDKARALERLWAEHVAAAPGAAAALYAGDDTGDRACFELVAGLGAPSLAVGVASTEAPPGLFDSCGLVLESVEEWVRRFRAWSGRLRRAAR